jgi:hypothetical protein
MKKETAIFSEYLADLMKDIEKPRKAKTKAYSDDEGYWILLAIP